MISTYCKEKWWWYPQYCENIRGKNKNSRVAVHMGAPAAQGTGLVMLLVLLSWAFHKYNIAYIARSSIKGSLIDLYLNEVTYTICIPIHSRWIHRIHVWFQPVCIYYIYGNFNMNVCRKTWLMYTYVSSYSILFLESPGSEAVHCMTIQYRSLLIIEPLSARWSTTIIQP